MMILISVEMLFLQLQMMNFDMTRYTMEAVWYAPRPKTNRRATFSFHFIKINNDVRRTFILLTTIYSLPLCLQTSGCGNRTG